jgi:hypothetical protein
MSGTALGSPLTTGKSPLKTCNKAKHTLSNHAGCGPRCKDLDGPPRRPSRRSPRAGSVPFEGVRFPRAGSAPLEGPLPLEQAPPRSRVRPALDRCPPRSRAPPLACACPRTRAFNALTPAGQCHHAPGARTPVLPHQLPRREPIPITVGRDSAARPVSVP